MNKNKLKIPIAIILSLIIISVALGFFSPLGFLESFRIVFGSIYILFIPGFILTYLFFPKTKSFDSDFEEKEGIDWIERVALSFALSIAIVPLIVFYLNLIGIKISALNTFIIVLFIIIGPSIYLYKKHKKRS